MGIPRLPPDILFVLGIGCAVAIAAAVGLGVWYFLDGTDGVQSGEAENGTVERTPVPRSSDPSPVETGITDQRILFGQSAAFSGPAQELGRSMGRGIEAAFYETNQGGGVHGRRLELLSLDDAYEPEAAIANTLHLIEEESVFCVDWGCWNAHVALRSPGGLGQRRPLCCPVHWRGLPARRQVGQRDQPPSLL